MIIEWMYLIVLIATLLSNIILIFLSWSGRQYSSANWFILLELMLTLLSLSYLIFAISEETPVINFWINVRYSFLTLSTIAFFFTVLSFTENEHYLHPRFIALNLIIPIGTIIVVWFFPDFFWKSRVAIHSVLINVEAQQFTGWFMVYAIHGYLLLIAGCIVLLRYAMRSTSISRKQAITFASGIVIVMILGLLPAIGLTDNMPSPVPIALSILSLHLFWALIKQGFLNLSSATYHSILQDMQDKVLVLDPQNRIVMFNQKAQRLIKEQTESNIIGKYLKDVFVESETFIDKIADVWEARFELTVPIQNQPTVLDIRMSPILNGRGQQQYKLIVLRDISLYKQAEQSEFELSLELERIRLLTNFMQNSAHEFKTPLSVIGTSSYIMARSEDSIKRQEKEAEIKKQIYRITKMIDTQLLLAKVENAQFDTQSPVDMAVLVKEVCEEMQVKHGDDRVLNCTIDPSPCTIRGDQDYLAAALEQILDNAYRYTPNQGLIEVCTQRMDNIVQVEIKDNGPGIPEDEVAHVFETFWRHDSSHSTPGMGVGLSIAKRIVEAHNGEIRIKSQVGKGTSVRITFHVN